MRWFGSIVVQTKKTAAENSTLSVAWVSRNWYWSCCWKNTLYRSWLFTTTI